MFSCTVLLLLFSTLHIATQQEIFNFNHTSELQNHDFDRKLNFLSAFIMNNHHRRVSIIAPWLMAKQRRALLKCLSFAPTHITRGGETIPADVDLIVYDMTGAGAQSIASITTHQEATRLLLIDDAFDLPAYLDRIHFDALPGRNLLAARLLDGRVKLSEVYRLVRAGDVHERYVTSWPNDTSTHRRRRLDFNGLRLPIAIVLNNAASPKHLDDFRQPAVDAYSKAHYGPVLKLLAFYNITPDFRIVRDFSHLRRAGEPAYFLTVTAPYMTTELVPHVDFVKVGPATQMAFALRRPPTSFVTTIFTVTFTPAVWYATLGLLALLCLALYVLLNVEVRRQDINGKTEFGVYDLLLIGLEAVCQQGTTTDPSSYASRILEVLMFMAFMFLYVAYSANILVLLQSTTALSDRDELLRYGVDYAGWNTTSDATFNYYAPDTAEAIFGTGINAPRRVAIDDGMERVRAGLFAFYAESRYALQYAARYYNDYEVCGLQELGAHLDFRLGYAALTKHSGYHELIKVGLFQIFEKGFANRHHLRYFLKPQCYSKGSSFDTIGIREVYQAILLVVAGVAVGLLVLAAELLLRRLSARNEPVCVLLHDGVRTLQRRMQ